MDRLKIIVSGYDHYEGIDVNPSMEVPKALVEQGVTSSGSANSGENPFEYLDVDIRAVSLPISFGRAWPILQEAIEDYQPNIVIATGLKRSVRSIALERCAVNLKDANKASESSQAEPGARLEAIDPAGPAAYWTRLPLRSILQAFAQDNIPATLSSGAGTYVCNSVFYSLLNSIRNNPRMLAGFVSLPPVVESSGGSQGREGLPLEQQIHAGQDVVREVVRYYERPSSSDMLIA